MIDLRSDTVTLPPPEMRRAMFDAELGDDCYGEDPTTNALEQSAAGLLGKEAALYVTSGTQGNLVAQLAHTRPGEEMILGQHAHTFLAEVAAAARIGGLSYRTIPQDGASLDIEAIRGAIRPPNIHYPRTGLIWVEQPSRGFVMPLDELEAIGRLGRNAGIAVHMDGARIFNAATYLGVEASEIAAHVDSVMFCVSKGLSAPVGSMVVGSTSFVGKARGYRKLLGGGLRQAGVIAAGGLYALQHMRERLRDDHDNARSLAAGLREIPGIQVDRDEVQTNIFQFCVDPAVRSTADFCALLQKQGVLVNTPNPGARWIRLVTHYGVQAADISRVVEIVSRVMRAR